MFSLLVNTYCNGPCPYCFAKSAMDGRQLDLADMDRLTALYRRYNQKIAGLFGGEPTLHPQIADIISGFSRNDLMPVVYSNGLTQPEVLEELVKTDMRVVLNINTREVYGDGLYQRLLANLDLLSAKLGRRVRVGVNFYKTGQDLESVLDILKRTRFDHHVRIGLASPIVDGANDYAPEEALRAIGSEIYGFIKMLLAAGCVPFFDCGIRLCMFSDSQLQDIKEDVAGPISHSACYRMFTLYPDLSISPCLTLAGFSRTFQLEEHTDFERLYRYYDRSFSPYAARGNLEQCAECRYFGRQCTGGCLARTIVNGRRGGPQQEH